VRLLIVPKRARCQLWLEIDQELAFDDREQFVVRQVPRDTPFNTRNPIT